MKININIKNQQLTLLNEQGHTIANFMISSAANGVGETKNSGCTPRGKHIIRAKIGKDQPINTVFVARRPTGEIYSDELAKQHPQRDWILTRILWLSGCERGFNRLGNCDTMARYIYIHGTPDEHLIGKPVSHGCIRMKNSDLIELFERVPVGTPVEIFAS